MSDKIITPVFKIKEFVTKMRKEHIDDKALLNAAQHITKNNATRHGENTFSRAVEHSKSERGSSKGYRIFAAWKNQKPLFFIDGYPRNKQNTMLKKDLNRCREFGNLMLNMNEKMLQDAIKNETIIKIGCV